MIKNKKLLTGHTPRQELFYAAIARAKRYPKWTAQECIEDSFDGAKDGTLKAAMRDYYDAATELAIDRLIAKVEKEVWQIWKYR